MAQPGSTGRPKYLLIADGLREKIKAGVYPVDSKLPPVHELAAAHGTAPNTVRSAISVLTREGLLESFQGDGIYVRKLPGPPGGQAGGTGALQAALERVELNLMDLYGKLGFDYPREDESAEPEHRVARRVRRA